MKIWLFALALSTLLYSNSKNTLFPGTFNGHLAFQLLSFEDTHLIETKKFDIYKNQHEWLEDFNGGTWRVVINVDKEKNGVYAVACDVSLERGTASQIAIQLDAFFDQWGVENYVLIPGAVYNGNRFKSLDMAYPPLMDKPIYFSADLQTTISNVPRLNISTGESLIEQTTGDPATPAMGFFSPSKKQTVWLLTDQRTRFGNSGLTVKEDKSRTRCAFSITAPAMRQKRQTMVNQVPSDDRAPDWQAGDHVHLHARLYIDRAKKVADLFEKFVEIRQDMTGSAQLKHQLPFGAAFRIQQKKYNEQNWSMSRGYYSVGMRENMAQDWQLGWVGGLMATLPLLAQGDSLSVERARQNIDTIISKTQAPSGFFYGIGDGTNWYGDGFARPHPHNMHMVRKSADALYFLSKQFLFLDKDPNWECPEHWRLALIKLADAFVKLWNTYGEFGQFVNIETGEMLVYGSTAGAMAPGGLAMAAHYLKDDKYLKTAFQSAQYYYSRDVKSGITTGGPGEILQCPDSESAFALLESFVTIYNITGKSEYKKMAEDMARQCATWVVSYDYQFPPESLFGRLHMNSTGSVIANVQNKHSAPGICTLSGNSLLHLYRASGDTFYLALLRDLSHNITQYLSRKDRPVGDMPPGWMNERVNLSDWEGRDKVGDIFNGSTWAEVACMLTTTEIPGVYVQLRSWDVWTFDHLDVLLVDKNRFGITLQITNPTDFTSTYSFLIEDSRRLKEKLDPVYFTDFKKVELTPGESKKIKITYKRFIVDEDVQRLPLPEYREHRIPQKSSGYIVPGYFWVPTEQNAQFFAMDMFVKTSTLYKPSNAPFRIGASFSMGVNALVAREHDEYAFLPLPYFGVGSEVRLFKYMYVQSHIANIAFPFGLFFELPLFYGGIDVGVRIPAKKGVVYFTFGKKSLLSFYDHTIVATPMLIQNVSMGFQF